MDATFINGHQVRASFRVENPRTYFARNGFLKPAAT